MQSFIRAVETGNTHELKSLINCQDQIGTLMHKTLLTFKHNLTAVLNGAALPYSNGCLEGFNRKIKQIERTAFGYSNFTNLLTRIRLEEDLYKKRTKQPFNGCLILFIYSLSTGFDKETVLFLAFQLLIIAKTVLAKNQNCSFSIQVSQLDAFELIP